MYSTLLALCLLHVCFHHTDDPTFTCSLEQLANHGPTESATGAGRRHHPPARLLRRFAPIMVRLHRHHVRSRQNHAATHKVPLDFGKTPNFADRHRPTAVSDLYKELQELLLRSQPQRCPYDE
jgi:hypothetical protein